jgi:hypothetical protein
MILALDLDRAVALAFVGDEVTSLYLNMSRRDDFDQRLVTSSPTSDVDFP